MSIGRKKFYEYIMMKFYEKINEENVKIDREDLYYYWISYWFINEKGKGYGY